MNGYDVWVIFGPTGSGKTDLAIELAKQVGGEIINLDSMQIYREIEIGTAKPTAEERAQVPHHLFDIASVRDDFTVADYQTAARQAIKDIQSRGRRPILVGGTGLYLSALYYDYGFRAYTNRDETTLIQPSDVITWQDQVDTKNPRRLQRAVQTGQVHQRNERVKSDLRFLIVWLDWPRPVLHERIEQRVDQMMDRGLLAEVQAMKEKFPLSGTSSARQGIGYKELMLYLDGQLDLAEAVELIKIHTRQYAKRQITWVKNQYDTVYRLDATRGVTTMVKEIMELGGLGNEE